MNPTDIVRARVLRDITRFGKLQSELGQHGVYEMAGLQLVNVTAGVRRRRIRQAARARKARRGWR